MWAWLSKIIIPIVRGAVWLLPFISSWIGVGVAGVSGLYLIFTWLYKVVTDNIQSILDLFSTASNAVESLQRISSGDTSNVIQALCYSCGLDTFFSYLTVYIGIVSAVLVFLLIGVIVSLIALIMPLIIGRCIQSLANIASKSLIGGT